MVSLRYEKLAAAYVGVNGVARSIRLAIGGDWTQRVQQKLIEGRPGGF